MTEQSKDEARARRAAERALVDQEDTSTPDVPAQVLQEQHLLSDLVANSPALLGYTSEALAGAVALRGWEMTQTVSLDQARAAIQEYLSTPA